MGKLKNSRVVLKVDTTKQSVSYREQQAKEQFAHKRVSCAHKWERMLISVGQVLIKRWLMPIPEVTLLKKEVCS